MALHVVLVGSVATLCEGRGSGCIGLIGRLFSR